ncbi:MAG: hypothetical protein PHU26_09815 [Methanofollis liminatans]|nr:hypothetical protein [Methanofollis liminatans]
MNAGAGAWAVLILPAIVAAGIAAYANLGIYSGIFSIVYLFAAIYSIKWESEGWILVFAAGEPLVLATAAAAPIFIVPVQVTVLWAAMLSGWGGEGWISILKWAVLGGVIVGIAGIAAIRTVHALPLLSGAVCAGIAAVAIVWLGELRLKKKVGIQ